MAATLVGTFRRDVCALLETEAAVMVNRYEIVGYLSGDFGPESDNDGRWVKYSDYAALQAALKEALDMAELFTHTMNVAAPKANANPVLERIAELRKQFLE